MNINTVTRPVPPPSQVSAYAVLLHTVNTSYDK